MRTRIKQILLVHPHLSIFGGAEILLYHLAQELVRAGLKVTLASLSVSGKIKRQFGDVVRFLLPKNDLEYKLRSTSFFAAMGLVREVIQLNRLLKAEVGDMDVINVHNFPSTWTVTRRFGKPIVWTCNEPPGLWNNPSPSAILKMAVALGGYVDKQKVRKHVNKIIVSDDLNRERIIKLYGMNPEVVNYGIDYDFFTRRVETDIRKKYHLENSMLLVQVGFFSPQKNQLESVKTLNEIKNTIPNAKLLFAGHGDNDYEEKVKRYVKDHGLNGRVLFLGHVARENIRELYQSADIGLFPTKAQGGWLAPFEAISAGVPTIVSPELTASTIIRDNDLGWVSDVFAPDLIEIVGNLGRARKKVEYARQWVKSNLSWQRYAEKMIEIFDQVTKKP